MRTVESGEFVNDAYHMALDYLTKVLGAERALIVIKAGDSLEAKGSRGFEADEVLADGDFSHGVLWKVLRSGDPVLRADVQRKPHASDNLSLQLSGVQTFLCVPYWEENGRFGVLYADSRNGSIKFDRNHSRKAVRFARHLERSLERARTGRPPENYREPIEVELRRPTWPTPESETASDPEPAKKKTRQTPTNEGPGPVLTATDRISCFRGLSIMLDAGVPISKSLELLSEQGESPALREATKRMSGSLLAGARLSEAARVLPHAFSPIHVDMLKMGEEAGALPNALRGLYQRESKSHELRLKVRAVMTYPVIVLLLCSGLLLLAPSFLLKSQLQFLAQSGGQVPLITKLMLIFSNFVSSPIGVATIVGLLLGCGWGLRVIANDERKRSLALRALDPIPVVGPALRQLALTRFSRALALCLKVGMQFTKALPVAASVTGCPIFEESIPHAVAGLKEGLSLGESLEATGLFPTLFLEFVNVGEETGKLDALMAHTALLCETKLEEALDTYTSLLEPLVLLFLGGATGLMMLATMLPMVEALKLL